MNRILVAEDEEAIANIIQYFLQRQACRMFISWMKKWLRNS